MSRFRVADDCTGINVEHQDFKVDHATITANGKTEKVASVRVPDALDERMAKMGYIRVGAMPGDHGPPKNEKGERTDGPTLAEYVAAGYSAEAYPPQGYASKEDPKELKKAQAEAKKKREADEKAQADADAQKAKDEQAAKDAADAKAKLADAGAAAAAAKK